MKDLYTNFITKQEAYINSKMKFESKVRKIIDIWNKINPTNRVLVDLDYCEFEFKDEFFYIIEKMPITRDYDDDNYYTEGTRDSQYKLPLYFLDNIEMYESKLEYFIELQLLYKEKRNLEYEHVYFYEIEKKLENKIGNISDKKTLSKLLGHKISLLNKEFLETKSEEVNQLLTSLRDENKVLSVEIKEFEKNKKARIAKFRVRYERDILRKRKSNLAKVEERISILELLLPKVGF